MQYTQKVEINRVVIVSQFSYCTALCSWTWHVTLAVPLSTQIHKWMLGQFHARTNPATDWPLI